MLMQLDIRCLAWNEHENENQELKYGSCVRKVFLAESRA